MGPAADIYALGAIAYRALTGRPAYTGTDPATIVHSVIYMMPPRPSDTSSLPTIFDLVLAVAIAKQPEDRFESPEALVAALESAARGVVEPPVRQKARRVLRRTPWENRRGKAAKASSKQATERLETVNDSDSAAVR